MRNWNLTLKDEFKTNETADQATAMIDGDFQQTLLKVFLWPLYILTSTLGSAMLLGIVHYEKFGDDPQKRSLGNRLASDMILLIVFSVNVGTVAFVSSETGLDNYIEWDTFIRIYRSALLAIVTYTNIHTLVAYLQVCVIKHIKEINDEFCSKFLRRVILLSNAWANSILPVNSQLHDKNPGPVDHWKHVLYPLEAR